MKNGCYKYYYLNGNILCEKYYLNDKLHREDGPAEIYYDKNGELPKTQGSWASFNRKTRDGFCFPR
jgi:antitoxin component YwqK of YwqJK toxin-antitoxin module